MVDYLVHSMMYCRVCFFVNKELNICVLQFIFFFPELRCPYEYSVCC